MTTTENPVIAWNIRKKVLQEIKSEIETRMEKIKEELKAIDRLLAMVAEDDEGAE